VFDIKEEEVCVRRDTRCYKRSLWQAIFAKHCDDEVKVSVHCTADIIIISWFIRGANRLVHLKSFGKSFAIHHVYAGMLSALLYAWTPDRFPLREHAIFRQSQKENSLDRSNMKFCTKDYIGKITKGAKNG
jgi:hypothetical protein